jgi:predicted secreted protein
MAKPTTYPASKLYISLGDGATPTETFTAPCGLVSKGIVFSKETNDTTVPDCDDPDAPAWTERGVRTLSAEVTGSGILAAEALPTWWAWYANTESANVRIGLNAPPADNGGYWAGLMHLTSFSVTSELGDKVQVAATLISDGQMVWVDAV